METLHLQLDEPTSERVRRLAAARQVTPEELVGDLVKKAELDAGSPGENGVEGTIQKQGPPDPLWGLFADIPDVMDEIVEEAMIARERYPFRADDR
jgi:hypothetical protein